MSIKDIAQKINPLNFIRIKLGFLTEKTKNMDWSFKNPILIIVIIILTALVSFGLGRLSFFEEVREPVKIEYKDTAQMKSGEAVSETVSGQVVASKSGAKYHFPWCSGAKSISPANLITFASAELARKAGYTPASNCKGLK